MMLLLQDLPRLVIVQVHGMAAAAGCQLLAACDLTIVEESGEPGSAIRRYGSLGGRDEIAGRVESLRRRRRRTTGKQRMGCCSPVKAIWMV
jgi:hypothetical protein